MIRKRIRLDRRAGRLIIIHSAILLDTNDPKGDCPVCVIPLVLVGLAALGIGEGILFTATGTTAVVLANELSKNMQNRLVIDVGIGYLTKVSLVLWELISLVQQQRDTVKTDGLLKNIIRVI